MCDPLVPMSKVRLVSKDGQEFLVEKKVVEISEIVKATLENLDDFNDPVPLDNIDGPTLEKVLIFCKKHSSDDGVSEKWGAEFCNMDNESLLNLILAANYMSIQPLLNLTCKKVADMIKGKSVEEIRATFPIANSTDVPQKTEEEE